MSSPAFSVSVLDLCPAKASADGVTDLARPSRLDLPSIL
jgi:hypothetical protein